MEGKGVQALIAFCFKQLILQPNSGRGRRFSHGTGMLMAQNALYSIMFVLNSID